MYIEYQFLNKHVYIEDWNKKVERIYTRSPLELWWLPGTINTKTGKYHPSRYYIVEIVSDSKAKILEESGITGNWFTTRKRLVRRIITLSRKV